jgi:hypothetical protein
MGPKGWPAVKNQKGLEELFGGLLGMKAGCVPGNLWRLQVVFDVEQICSALASHVR